MFYLIVPSKRRQGYGTIFCHLLLVKMKNLGFIEALVTCFDSNFDLIKIIDNNAGKFIDYYFDETEENSDFKKIEDINFI